MLGQVRGVTQRGRGGGADMVQLEEYNACVRTAVQLFGYPGRRDFDGSRPAGSRGAANSVLQIG